MRIPGRFAAAVALSTAPDTTEALDEVLAALRPQIGSQPDLVVVFFTPHHAAGAEQVSFRLRDGLTPDCLVGCSASGVVGGSREVEHGPGLVVWAARLPGARVQSFHLEFEGSSGGVVHGWPMVDQSASVVLMVDPFSFPLGPFLDSLRATQPSPNLVGGVASGGSRPGANRLLVDERVVSGGAVGLALDGAASLEPLVSQGCRPVGRPFTITRSERNMIYELDSAPAYEGLSEVVGALDDDDSRAFRNAPQVGLAAVASSGDLGQEAYLIRGVVGIDQDSGVVAISDAAPEGMQLRFHARDGASAHEDFGNLLGLASGLYPEAVGGLMFTCTGRGRNLFDDPDHDARLTGTYFPELPVAGMFAAGELGSVCGKPYIHGFSASFGLLVEREG